MWSRSKSKNKIWHFGHHRHIAFLKRTHKQVKIRYSVYIHKTTRTHSERILTVSLEIWHTKPDELALLSKIWSPKSVTMIKRIEGVQRRATRLMLPDLSHNERLKRLNLLPPQAAQAPAVR